MLLSPIARILNSVAFKDVGSGLASRILPGFAQIVAVPVLLHLLGPDRYAAIGLFLTIQSLASLLDIGISSGIARQSAWLTGANAGAEEFASLLRGFEIPYLIMTGVLLLAAIFGGFEFLEFAFGIDPQSVGLDPIATTLLFGTVVVRLPLGIYFGYLSGRRHIQAANVILMMTDLARILGALVLVVFVDANLSIFFGWQCAVVFIAVTVAYGYSRHITPFPIRQARPNWQNLQRLTWVMLGAGQMQLLFIVASTADKLILPRFVSSTDYGLYVAVGQLAIANYLILQPIWSAFHPRLLSAVAANDRPAARQTFLSATGLMTAACCAFIVGTLIATPAILRLWVGARGADFGMVLIAIAVGYGLCGLSHLALTVHQAAERYFPTPLIFSAALVVVPIIGYLTASRIDASAVAVILAVVYCAEFLAGALTFRLYAPQFLSAWFIYLVCPLVMSLAGGAALSLWTHDLSTGGQMIVAVPAAALVFVAIIAANPAIRTWIKYHRS